MKKEFSELIDRLFTQSRELGILQLVSEDSYLDGKHITARGRRLMYFGSCSYLGLETDNRLKEASIDAINRFGSQLSCSRGSVSLGLYQTLEDQLSEIFGKPTLLAPTTSLGHISTIPVIMGERDVLIVDHQVHNSVRNAVQMVKGDGVKVEVLPHNRMDMLETRIQILRQEYDRVWYFCDGIYSMYGDTAPFSVLNDLLNRYEQFHLYVDDAHGMGWVGKHGRGYCLSEMLFHERMILTSSLAKAFASCGGTLTFNTEAERNLIRNCGSSFIFSGPLQPAVLGASVASALIYLSPEIEQLQDKLFERMMFFSERARQLRIPIITNEMTPIFYIGVGKQEIGYKMAQFLLDQGYYCNHVIFPAVPVKNTGLRIALTNHHTIEDLSALLDKIAEGLFTFLKEEDYTVEQIYEAFNVPLPPKAKQVEFKSITGQVNESR